MAEQPDFLRTQYAFAAHIRDPENKPAPAEIEDRRMAIYRDLFYNNIEGFLATNFPVLKSILSEKNWHELARDFFVTHRCKTPYFLEIAEEFLGYLQQERQAEPWDPPFMLELAHYEWTELVLSIADEESIPDEVDPNGDLVEAVPVLSSLVWNLSYRFPVHRISAEFMPDRVPDEPSHLVVFRDRTDEVRFLEINAVTQRLIQLMKENPDARGLDLIETIATELGYEDAQAVLPAGTRFLEDLRSRGIIVGSRKL